MPDTSALSIVNLADAMEAVRQSGLPMHGAPAEGLALHSNGHLGADVVHVRPHDQFPVHTHPGDHLLLCLAGEGTIAVDGIVYAVRPGDIYMVDGMVPHAVGAGGTDHYLVAIGAPHKAVDDPERMAWTDWAGAAVDSPLFAPAGPRPAKVGEIDPASINVHGPHDIPTRPSQRERPDSFSAYPESVMFGPGNR